MKIQEYHAQRCTRCILAMHRTRDNGHSAVCVIDRNVKSIECYIKNLVTPCTFFYFVLEDRLK